MYDTAGEIEVNRAQKTVTTSKILQWYGSDFGTKEELLRMLSHYAPTSVREDLRQLLAEGAADVRLKFKQYDWGINTK